MTDSPQQYQSPAETVPQEESQALLLQLRRKEGNWVSWGKACQRLQRSGLSSNAIFEDTGFEAAQQNMVIIAANVYDSLLKGGAVPGVVEYFADRGSAVLYELRQLDQVQRVKTATLAMERGLDEELMRDIAKSVKDYARVAMPPPGFGRDPGDAVAYFCWKRARERSDLQDRSRQIAQGLKFAVSAGARQALETLLTDFTVVATEKAPNLPLYRMEQEEEIPRLIPVAGAFPLSRGAIEGVQALRESGVFRTVVSEAGTSWMAVPGWQAVLGARDPVAVVCHTDDLPQYVDGVQEPIALLVERSERDWSPNHYSLVEVGDRVEIFWGTEPPEGEIVGRIVVILRPKHVLDESAIAMPWLAD
jgi:hypothetical protein